MMPSRRALAPLALLLLAGAAGAAPPKAPAGARFGEAATVVSIEVPVTVVRGDEPVRGLTAADFELYDGRKRQRITGFEVVDLGAAAAAPAATPAAAAPGVPISGRRHFLLLFDLSFSEPAALVKAQEAARGLLRKGVHPSDLVAVATYSTAGGPKLVLGFSPDRRQAEYAIDTLGAPQLVDRSPDPLGLIYLSDKAETGGANPIAREPDSPNQASALAYFQEVARVEARAERQGRKNDVTAMSRSLADLAKRMAGIEGKKYVVLLSQGFDSEFFLGTTDEEKVKKAQAAAVSGSRLEIDSEQRYGDTRISSDLHRMLDEFRRADCTIESVDIGGLRAGGDQDVRHAGGKESLFFLARETGGDLFENTNDLGGAMGRMLERTSVTYILSFEPGELGEAGSYHELRVALAGERAQRGSRVVYRPGYYAPRPFLARSPLERRLAAASQVLSAGGGRIATAVLAAPLPLPGGSGGGAYVPVVVEADGPALLAGATDTAQAEVFVYAFDARGTVHDHFGQIAELEVAKVRGTLEKGGVKLYGRLDLAPGSYVLRALVRNGITGETGLAVVPLTVPAFDRGEAALLPPLVADAPGRWLNLRAAGSGRERPVPYPFTSGGRPFLPAARPVIAAGAETPLLLLGTGLGAGELAVAGRVLGADGWPREGAAVAFRGPAGDAAPDAPADAGVERRLATFRAGSLPAGDYTLVVTLTDKTTRRELSSSLPFVITAPAQGEGRR
jgi:VWFA-related protein